VFVLSFSENPAKDGTVCMEKLPLNGKLLRHVFALVCWDGICDRSESAVVRCLCLSPRFVFRIKRHIHAGILQPTLAFGC